MDSPRRPTVSGIAMTVVVAAHVLLLALILKGRPPTIRDQPYIPIIGELVFLEEPPVAPRPPHTRKPVQSEVRLPSATPTPPLPLTPTARPPPKVDWYGTASAVARQTDLAKLTLQQSGCDATRRPRSLLPTCGKYHAPPIGSESRKAGFDRGVVYVRLGKRCAFGVGILAAGIGCTIGTLPQERGGTAMYEDLRNQNRPTISVPDLPGRTDIEEMEPNGDLGPSDK